MSFRIQRHYAINESKLHKREVHMFDEEKYLERDLHFFSFVFLDNTSHSIEGVLFFSSFTVA